MNGSWCTGELLVLQQGQQQQQQQQRQQHQQRTVVEEQRQPPNSPTTPVWRIVDRIVKEEPPEDYKNNDSGVSPDHYTSNSASPRSRRSSSTANCSLSPGSVTSQDSNVMQSSTFEYSPRRFFKSCDSPLEFPRMNTMDETSSHQSDQNVDLMSGSIKRMSEDVVVNQDNFQCPICAFTSINRLQFSDHLMSHCTTNCDTPELTKMILSRLASQTDDSNWTSPSQGDRSEQDSEELEEPGLRVPRINSQGKVKTFRCKHCEFVAITKVDFWEHGKSHIKADKLLACPKCPFVTEHKHHLEYHLRNHYGSKPFKCDKCSYVCVNKSMLNSHLKSHSNVYQYRCANCTYATKYCHSLKLHLRKYMHQPDMVLNADGSPNPLPIIDVYGTRRGPKQKSSKIEDPRRLVSSHVQPAKIVGPPQVSPVSHSPHDVISPINGHSQPQNSMMATFPFGQIYGGYTLPNHFVFTDDNKQLEQLKSKLLLEYIKALNKDKIPEDFSQFISKVGLGTVEGSNGTRETNMANGTRVTNESVDGVNNIGGSSSTITSINVKSELEVIETKAAPLDLSKSENSANGPSTNSSRATGTRRRKGKAVKLNRRVLEEDEDDDDIEGSFETASSVRTR